MVVEGVSQQLQFNHYCGLFITSFIGTCRDLNFRPQLCAVMLAHFSLTSRLIIVFRDISKLWKDNLLSGCDNWHFYLLLVNK